MKITVKHTYNGQQHSYTYDAASITAGTALQILGKDDAIGNGLKLTAPLLQIVTETGDKATFDAQNVVIIPADNRTQYENHSEETLHAAIAYIEAAERIKATWTKLDIIRFCCNTFPELKVSDALSIADTIRGMYIHRAVTVIE